MSDVWPRFVACPQTRRLGAKRLPCGDLRAIGWKPDGPPSHYVCTHCYTKWTNDHVASLTKARSHVAKIPRPEPHDEPELPGFEGRA